MKEVQLKVEKAYISDVGRGLIGLSPKILVNADLALGDIVEIMGKKKTTAVVAGTKFKDINKETARIDHFIQQNAGVTDGESITIKKVEVPEAKKLILALPEGMIKEDTKLYLGEREIEILKKHIFKKPIYTGDIVPIIIEESQDTSKITPLITVETDPANTIVQVSEKTAIIILNEVVQLEEYKEWAFKYAINEVNHILEPHDLAIKRNENTGEIILCEVKETFISASKSLHKKITFSPSVFEVPKKSNVTNCVSVMISFSKEFDSVYGCINEACYEIGMSCHKADDFWHHSAIIQDIFELIFRSSIVIVDFTGKNSNVFYEAGVAHALGKTVLPITQNSNDIPFDLRHHRYILYRNDREGLKKLKRDLVSKLNFEKSRGNSA
ncbi:MAG: hypothetical protein AAGU10_15420 [Methanosarcina mazei]|uniref:hypothetical protein n=1 Tax=Methanosarcina soligelidi TaxID=1036677 RepID=UPI00069F7974|nr:hypothetical protein [Methanosarcina soligelidi]